MIPVIGEVRLDELRRRDVRNVSDQIMRRGRKTELIRTYSDLRSMISWAVENEYLDANPIDGMTKPAEETSRDRVLNDDEFRTLWAGLPKALPRSVQCQRIIKLCLVTAQRVGEVSGLRFRPSSILPPANGAFLVRAQKTRTPTSCRCRIWRFES